MDPITTKAIVAHGCIALFGGLVHALQKHRQGKAKNFLDIMLLALISSFTGVIFALIALHALGGEHYLTLAAAGTGGFLGVEGMALVVERFRRVISEKP